MSDDTFTANVNEGIVTVTTVGGHGGSGRDCRHEVAT